ncbi:membrane-binding protein [Leptospira ainlahdjerensis]|uniref:membrane-binding protein n=1 Tax=Leptospira ainlahdjerensis TaxID=2810033 RepID=UPI001E38AF5C|nr:membrane-binding protein [Leptospira ainlahdjerensis]
MIRIESNSIKVKLTIAVLILTIAVSLCYFFFLKGKCDGNCKNGFGSKIYWDGKKYVGQWKDGEQDGFGVLIAKDRKIIFSGKWQSGNPTVPNEIRKK